ncbi:MAG: hypothetical protein IPI57_15740 [Candidatus Competibacteraceae bacterium]|nr:hypothetical protein [Candidatus Competibacteraceae bacterium]
MLSDVYFPRVDSVSRRAEAFRLEELQKALGHEVMAIILSRRGLPRGRKAALT